MKPVADPRPINLGMTNADLYRIALADRSELMVCKAKHATLVETIKDLLSSL